MFLTVSDFITRLVSINYLHDQSPPYEADSCLACQEIPRILWKP
jgi:hypothetical protein